MTIRYKVSELEDQILTTLRADIGNFPAATHTIETFAGQINLQTFFDPALMQNFVKLLPFTLVSYQGRIGAKSDRDSSGKIYMHTLTFRIYNGAQSLRATQDAVRGAYDMLAAVFDDLHAKVPVTDPQQLPGYTPLSGTALTSSEVNVLGPFCETGGRDEQIIVNLPGIVVYASDWSIKMLA